MRTLSIRELSSLAYERGEEFDPAMAPTPDLVAELSSWERAASPVGDAGPYERRRARERSRRQELRAVPEWFSLQDLVERPAGVLGELV